MIKLLRTRRVLVSTLPFILVLIVIIGKFYYSILQDNPLTWAQQKAPLGQKHIYIITKNTQSYFEGTESFIPPGSFYTVWSRPIMFKPDPVPNPKSLPLSEQNFGIIGSVVGSSDIDIEPYLGKRVWIEGIYKYGTPSYINPVPKTSTTSPNDKVVVHIKKLHLVSD